MKPGLKSWGLFMLYAIQGLRPSGDSVDRPAHSFPPLFLQLLIHVLADKLLLVLAASPKVARSEANVHSVGRWLSVTIQTIPARLATIDTHCFC